jgi:hypothetical protein
MLSADELFRSNFIHAQLMASIQRLGEISWPGVCNNDELFQVEFIHFITCLIKKNMPAAAAAAAAAFAMVDNLRK